MRGGRERGRVMINEIENCGECPANGVSDVAVDQCMIWRDLGQRIFKWRKVDPAVTPAWCPLKANIIDGD